MTEPNEETERVSRFEQFLPSVLTIMDVDVPRVHSSADARAIGAMQSFLLRKDK